MSLGWCNTYDGRKVSRVGMCEVRSKKNGQEPKKKKEKNTVVSSKKESTVMSPIQRQMKKRNPSGGQNDQLVHWWVLIHSGLLLVEMDGFVFIGTSCCKGETTEQNSVVFIFVPHFDEYLPRVIVSLFLLDLDGTFPLPV